MDQFRILFTKIFRYRMETNDRVFDRLQVMINKVSRQKKSKEINLTDHIKNDLGFDSYEIVELVLEIEYKFDIDLLDNISNEMSTVQNLLNQIERQLNRKQNR